MFLVRNRGLEMMEIFARSHFPLHHALGAVVTKGEKMKLIGGKNQAVVFYVGDYFPGSTRQLVAWFVSQVHRPCSSRVVLLLRVIAQIIVPLFPNRWLTVKEILIPSTLLFIHISGNLVACEFLSKSLPNCTFQDILFFSFLFFSSIAEVFFSLLKRTVLSPVKAHLKFSYLWITSLLLLFTMQTDSLRIFLDLVVAHASI